MQILDRGGGAGLAVSNSCAGLPAHWPGVHRQHSQELAELTKWWLVKRQTEFYVNVAQVVRFRWLLLFHGGWFNESFLVTQKRGNGAFILVFIKKGEEGTCHQ